MILFYCCLYIYTYIYTNIKTIRTMKTLIENDFTRMLQETKPCIGLERIEESISCSGIQVLKSKHEFPNNDVLIVRSQWSKTQGSYSIRVNNYYNNKRHFLQIGLDTLKQCRAFITELEEKGEAQLWTGHHVKVK